MAGILDGIDRRTQMAGQNRLELLLFRLERPQLYGINVFKVQEVIQCPRLTHVPGSHPAVRGIANMRGKTIPVMDLAFAINGTPMSEIKEKYVIITEYNRKTQGFLVGSVDRIVNLDWGKVLPPPKGAAGGSYLTAVTQFEKTLVEIIDVEKVLDEIVVIDTHVSEGILENTVKLPEQHILVVDDSVVARNQIKRVLDQIGVECTLKKDGAEALAQLKTWEAEKDGRVSQWLSMVISDIEMPKMDGYTLTSSVRDDAGLADVYMLLHSSLSGVFNEAMVRKVGANKFLPKYDPDELAKIVEDRLKEHAEARQS